MTATRLLLAPIAFCLLAGCTGTSYSPYDLPVSEYRSERYEPVGVVLSPREYAQSEPTRLSNGQVAMRPNNQGLPWLYGLGGVYGKASGKPLVNGLTPSVLANTPSGGIVPGQEQF